MTPQLPGPVRERPAYGGSPQEVLFDEKRREDALRSVGVRFVRLVDDDLGTGWPPVEARIRRDLLVPGPVPRSFRAFRGTSDGCGSRVEPPGRPVSRGTTRLTGG